MYDLWPFTNRGRAIWPSRNFFVGALGTRIIGLNPPIFPILLFYLIFVIFNGTWHVLSGNFLENWNTCSRQKVPECNFWFFNAFFFSSNLKMTWDETWDFAPENRRNIFWLLISKLPLTKLHSLNNLEIQRRSWTVGNKSNTYSLVEYFCDRPHFCQKN